MVDMINTVLGFIPKLFTTLNSIYIVPGVSLAWFFVAIAIMTTIIVAFVNTVR